MNAFLFMNYLRRAGVAPPSKKFRCRNVRRSPLFAALNRPTHFAFSFNESIPFTKIVANSFCSPPSLIQPHAFVV